VISLDDEQIYKKILDSVTVSSHMIALAKSFLLNENNFFIETNQKCKEFVEKQNYSLPKQFVFNTEEEIESQIKNIIGYFSYSIAFCESVHALIHEGFFLPRSSNSISFDRSISWTTGRNSSGWSFKEFYMHMPVDLVRTISTRINVNNIISDPDIYILDLGIDNAHNEVNDALRDSIKCFKNDLYHPSIIMLCKAVEGAWIELGISLTESVRDRKQDAEHFIERLIGQESIAWKVNEIVKLYERQDWFKQIKKDSRIDLNLIREGQNWTDLLRDARNAIHYGVQPSTPNTYDKASILLLGAIKHLRTIYQLKRTLDNENCVER
jgi:hypothetical protein